MARASCARKLDNGFCPGHSGGDTQTARDVLDPARAAALHATLGLDGATPCSGEALPPFWHRIYFWEARPPHELGREGHPKTGGFIPDLGLPRRMWAGGRLAFASALRVGIPAEKRSTAEAVVRKRGRSGPLAFVTLRHEIVQTGAVVLSEWQDLVY